tara:strand:- start:173 stop:451 length:279 start_codon:yes stop_codon:yes gene_type:complete
VCGFRSNLTASSSFPQSVLVVKFVVVRRPVIARRRPPGRQSPDVVDRTVVFPHKGFDCRNGLACSADDNLILAEDKVDQFFKSPRCIGNFHE